MLNTLLFLHLVIGVLLIVTILLQKTSADGLSGIGGSSSNTGVINSKLIMHFLVRTTVILTIAFFTNAIILANLMTQKPINFNQNSSNIQKSSIEVLENKTSLPIAK